MIKNNKIILAILTSVILFSIYFFSNYRIFFSPFEILSNKTIEQNLQGICVDEGRKLSKEELLRRALVSYFAHESSGQYFDDPSDYAWKDRCPTEKSCQLYMMPAIEMGDYIFDKEKRISLLKARNNGVTFSRADHFFPKNVRYQSHKLPFGFYASNRFSSFYPYDCCGIKEKSELLKSDYPFNGTPELLEQRGLGNYFLDLKIVSEGMNVYYHRYIVNNCGQYIPDKYSSVQGNYTKYMTTSYGFYLPQDFIQIVSEIPIGCWKWNYGKPDNSTINSLTKSFDYMFHYQTLWDGNDFYSCLRTLKLREEIQ